MSGTPGVLAGRVAFVTGGSRGIGRGIALELAACGAQVAITYRTRQDAAEQTRKSIEEAGGRALVLRCDVADLMAGVDVLVSPSLCEGFPNVLGEAMAVGTPCVATEAGGCREVLGDTGVLVPVGDADALAAALSELLDAGPETWSRMADAARRRVEDRFELHAVAKRYGDFYEELLACAG